MEPPIDHISGFLDLYLKLAGNACVELYRNLIGPKALYGFAYDYLLFVDIKPELLLSRFGDLLIRYRTECLSAFAGLKL